MKLSTARKLVCMSYFTQSTTMRDVLATATRIVHSADTTRYLFPDGSVIESKKGNWKVVGMEKNAKLEAAVRRFGSGQVLPDRPWPRGGGYTGAPKNEVAGVVAPGAYSIDGRIFTTEEICKHFKVPFSPEDFPETAKPFVSERTARLQMEVLALQELCNEKDEQLDKASRPMVVRIDWLTVALVALVLVAHYGFGVL